MQRGSKVSIQGAQYTVTGSQGAFAFLTRDADGRKFRIGLDALKRHSATQREGEQPFGATPKPKRKRFLFFGKRAEKGPEFDVGFDPETGDVV